MMTRHEKRILTRAKLRLSMVGVEVRRSPFSGRDEFLLVDEFNGSRVGNGVMTLDQVAAFARSVAGAG